MQRGSRENRHVMFCHCRLARSLILFADLRGETFPVSSFALPRLTSYPCPTPPRYISSGGGGAGLCFPPHSVTFKLQEELQVLRNKKEEKSRPQRLRKATWTLAGLSEGCHGDAAKAGEERVHCTAELRPPLMCCHAEPERKGSGGGRDSPRSVNE